jgi:WD40 repeat protein
MDAFKGVPRSKKFEEQFIVIQYDVEQSGPIHSLICGTNTGQIVAIDVKTNGKLDVLMQAHTAPIVDIKCVTETMQVISAGADGAIKIWRIAFSGNGSTDSHHVSTSSSSRPGSVSDKEQLTIDLVSDIAAYCMVSLPDNCYATSLSMNLRSKTLAVGTNTAVLYMYVLSDNGFEGSVNQHVHIDDHTNVITQISSLDSMGLFASSSFDGTVRIWDAYENVLIRFVISPLEFPK